MAHLYLGTSGFSYDDWKGTFYPSKMTSKDEMPQELLSYIDFIEKEVNVPISVVSVGPDRKEFIQMK